MKRKVQAQRKFAQGAYIPNHNNNLPVRLDQTVTTTKEDRSIVHNNIQAKHMLDIVSFQSIHPHAPRVLLKRLEESPALNGHTDSPSEPPEKRAAAPVSPPEPDKNTPSKDESSGGKIRYKSRGSTVKKPVIKQKNVPERPMSSSDDEFPLNHFKKLAKPRQATKNTTGDKDTIVSSSPEKSSPEKNRNKTSPEKRNIDNSLLEKTHKDKGSHERISKDKPQKSSTEKLYRKKSSPQKKNIIGKSDRITRSVKFVVVTKGVTKKQGKIDSFFTKNNVKLNLGPHVRTKPNKTIVKKNVSKNCDNKVTNSPKTSSIEVPRESSRHLSNSESAVNPPESTDNQPESAVNQHVYLDLLPGDSPHVIQLTSEKNKNQKKQMMRARLIPKSQAKTPQDLSLVQDEPILGAWLRNLEKRTDEVVVLSEVQDKVVDISSDSDESTFVLDEEPPRIIESSSLLHGFDQVKPLEAPTFQLTEEEFDDPIAFFKRIAPVAAKFGVCKIVAPPNHDPKCVLSDDISFRVTNQYIARLYSRWGPAMREMCAIKACLASQNTMQFRSPSLEGLELNLPKLHRLVQRHGGLSQVLGLKKWNRVAEEMRVYKNSGTKTLERISMRTLLPYDALSAQERQQLLAKIEKGWNRKNQKLLEWAINPLHRQKKLLGGSDSEEDDTDEDSNVTSALKEAEDCIVKGRSMTLNKFKKVADNAKEILLGRDHRTCSQIEEEYWRMVLLGTEHVCVNTASIDTGKCGYGFPRGKNDVSAKHPWNLKMVSQNSGNVLRSLGMVVGATVPTLHLGMVFSTSCWHRDPHGLPWLEYMHHGPPKIWYGIPDEQSANFRKAVETLCPTSCQNKSIWLPSDITMIPPELLRTHGVQLARVEQNPGEYIMVFPKAYSCSICTGYTVSESVYFATDSWLKDVDKVFQELRESCEPTTFSLEQLLMSLASDARSPRGTLLLVRDTLVRLLTQEAIHRAQLAARGLAVAQELRSSKSRGAASDAWNDQEECDVCRTTLYLSKVTFIKGPARTTCPEHALRLLDLPRMRDADVGQITLSVMFTQQQLDQCVASLQRPY